MRIALVTCAEARDHDADLPLLTAALADRGAEVELPHWDDPDVDWSAFTAVIVRSTWNYTDDPAAFIAWMRDTDGRTMLLNDARQMAWALDKRYMASLARAGVATVPTVFVAPGDPGTDLPAGPVVVKPGVGAGSRDTARHEHHDDARQHIAALHATGRTAMVQPHMAAVDTEGESGMVHIDGRLSHTIRKGPMLTGDRAVVGGLFLEEDIRPRTASPAEVMLAQATLSAVPGPTPLYARVDLIPGPAGPLLLELELVEPSLFVDQAPDAAARFAGAVMARTASTSGAATRAGRPSSS
ncbi:MAG: hypothetical protein U0Y82_03930 [Thermoleophilia bacterium]